jgi:aspartyl-tRNA(Asn)/glutamyl-tRNA(Gln) amidotransferase subunit C
MALSPKDVEHIAYLARLAIAEADVPRYAQDLSAILDFVAQMNLAQTDAVDPLAHPIEAGQRLRADEVTEVDARERFQAVAPQVEAGLYLVPKVIE